MLDFYTVPLAFCASQASLEILCFRPRSAMRFPLHPCNDAGGYASRQDGQQATQRLIPGNAVNVAVGEYR